MPDLQLQASPRVSVLLNSFNQGEYLASAIKSVLGQTFVDWEMLITDNGSTDGSQQIAQSFADRRIRLFLHERNEPISQRFNEAVHHARGEFVGFLYSDDFYLPRKLGQQVETFDRLPRDFGVVYAPADTLRVDTGERSTRGSIKATGDVFEAMMLNWRRGEIDMVSPLIRREALLAEPFYEDIFAEGEAIFYRLAVTQKFAYLAEPVVVLRDHERNAGKAIRRNCEMTRFCLARLREHPAISPSQRGLVDRYELSMVCNYAWQGARVGADSVFVRSCLRRAHQLSARAVLNPEWVSATVLCSMPAPLRHRVNELGHRLSGAPERRAYVEDYEGLQSANTITGQ